MAEAEGAAQPEQRSESQQMEQREVAQRWGGELEELAQAIEQNDLAAAKAWLAERAQELKARGAGPESGTALGRLTEPINTASDEAPVVESTNRVESSWTLPAEVTAPESPPSSGSQEVDRSPGPWDDQYMNTLDAVIQGKYGTGVTNFRRMSQAEQTPSRSLALERKVQEALAAIEQNPTRSPQMQEWIPELKKQFSTLFPDAVAVSEPPAPSRPVQSEQPRPAQPTQPEVQSPQPPQSQATSQPENPLGAETQGQGGISPSRLALYRGEGMTGQAEVDVNIWKQKTAGIGSERVSPDGFDNSGLIKGSEAALKADKLGTLAKLPSESQPGQFDLVPLSWHGYSEPQRLMMEQFFDVEVAQGATPNYRAELIRPSTVTADNALVSKGLIRLVTKT